MGESAKGEQTRTKPLNVVYFRSNGFSFIFPITYHAHNFNATRRVYSIPNVCLHGTPIAHTICLNK